MKPGPVNFTLKLIEPEVDGKRQSIIAERLRQPTEFDPEEIKTQLKQIRAYTVRSLASLKTKLTRTLTIVSKTQDLKLGTIFAKDAQEAVDYLRALSGGKPAKLAINKSSTVEELIPALQEHGFEINDTYTEELKVQDPEGSAVTNYWEIKKISDSTIWDSLSTVNKISAHANKKQDKSSKHRGLIGLLGVNTISAESGNIFLVQHLHNIPKIVAASDKLVFVVGLEKIVDSDADALFQARCCGLFGLDNILLELFSNQAVSQGKSHRTSSGTANQAASNEDIDYSEIIMPSEVHIIILDNGRRALSGSKFQELLDCIGCKACARMCPRIRKGASKCEYEPTPKNLAIPTTPRDILFSGFTNGTSYAAEHGLFDCTTCGNCEKLCPIDIPLPELVLKMRELCTKQNLAPEVYYKISKNIEINGNPYISA